MLPRLSYNTIYLFEPYKNLTTVDNSRWFLHSSNCYDFKQQYRQHDVHIIKCKCVFNSSNQKDFILQWLRLLNHQRSWFPKRKLITSVTRLCKISPLWYNFIVFGHFLGVYFVFGKSYNLLLHILMFLGIFSLFQMAQYWSNNLAIWLHC